ncbi:MAG: hypothetical protein HOI02_02175, partial [Rhodospirillaceae bacterium]|nr:hypothetical protein [Rhodospirillaceae bacterium]
MKVPTGLDAGLGQILPDATPVKQQTLTVPEGAFGGVRAKQLSSLATGVQGIGSIIDAEIRKSRAKDAAAGARRGAAAEARELTQQAQRQRADEIAAEQAEEDFENGLAAAAKAMPAPGVAGAGDKYREIDKALPRLAMGALGPLPPEERRKLAPYIASRTDMARAHLVQQQQAYTEAGAQAARQAKLKRGLESVIAADGGAFEMAQAEALIDDVARREAVDQGWSDAETNAYRLAEERKLSTAVFDSLLARGNAVAAELFKESMAEGIWDEATRQKKDGLLLKSLERENAADTIGALLERMPDHAAALAEAKRINNKQVKALVLEALEVRNTLEARTAFDARARGFVDLYTTLGDAGGDLGAVTEAQWQAQDGPGAGDDKGKPRGEAKAARKLAKKLRQGTPVETDWGLYYRLSNLPPKELAEVPIWDHAEKLNRSEFLLLAERQQQTRAALATGAPFSAAGAPGSLDAQLAALATRMGWDSAAQAETRGLIEREIRAEIAEAAAANGG